MLENELIVNVFCSLNQSACITRDGQTFVWGDSRNGQLGISSLDVYVILITNFIIYFLFFIKRFPKLYHHVYNYSVYNDY